MFSHKPNQNQYKIHFYHFEKEELKYIFAHCNLKNGCLKRDQDENGKWDYSCNNNNADCYASCDGGSPVKSVLNCVVFLCFLKAPDAVLVCSHVRFVCVCVCVCVYVCVSFRGVLRVRGIDESVADIWVWLKGSADTKSLHCSAVGASCHCCTLPTNMMLLMG